MLKAICTETKILESEMKKLVMSILTILTCGAAYALPVGNPGEASLFTNGLCWESTGCCDPCDPCFSWCDAWSFRVGFYGDYVYNRHLEAEVGGVDTGNLEDAELFTNAGYLALNFCDRFDIFTTLGATSFRTRQDTMVFTGVAGVESDLYFNSAFSWSIGGRATLWQCDCFTLGIEGQYFRSNPELDHSVDYLTGAKTYFDDFDTTYSEWQVGLGVSYRIATSCPTLAFVPYVAVKYSKAHWTGDDDVTLPLLGGVFDRFRSDKHWGWALGLSFTMCDLIGVTVEGRWADEKALYVNGQVRF